MKANSLRQIEPLILSPSTSHKFLTSERNSKSFILRHREREKDAGGGKIQKAGAFSVRRHKKKPNITKQDPKSVDPDPFHY